MYVQCFTFLICLLWELIKFVFTKIKGPGSAGPLSLKQWDISMKVKSGLPVLPRGNATPAPGGGARLGRERRSPGCGFYCFVICSFSFS